MTSSPFERQIAKGESSENGTTSQLTGMSSSPQQYEHGPSFLEHDTLAVRLVELPAWLQAFAASVGEPSELEPAVPDIDSMAEAGHELPAPGASVPAVEQAPRSTQLAEAATLSSSFISEDDLPEWLRSIAPDGQDAGHSRSGGGSAANEDHLSVPNISRAWSTSDDARGVDESTSLFALVASQSSPSVMQSSGPNAPTQGFLIREEGAGAKGVSAADPGTAAQPSAGVASLGGEFEKRVQPAVGAEDRSGESSRTLPIPILAIGLLIVILVIVALLLFVL